VLTNRVTDKFGTIGGGAGNQAGDDAGTTVDAYGATVGGGSRNTATKASATVAGGEGNFASGGYATVGGGGGNTASGDGATVGGGGQNTASGDFATVAGGGRNQADADYATIAGGGPSNPEDNPLETRNLVTDDYGTIGGGGHNQAGDNAGTTTDSYYATVAGGRSNEASGSHATVAGGFDNTAAGDYSFAVGRRAKAIHDGAFVWGDSQNADVVSTADNQVTFRCGGGVRFWSGSLGKYQDLSWAPGNASWTFSSDRSLKENFVEIDPKEVLERVSRLPITEWNFKGYALRHVGPVAQDFHALFPLGGTETMIDSGDLQGVALAAIQGLHEMLREKDAEIAAIKEQNSNLQQRLSALEKLLDRLSGEWSSMGVSK